MPQDDEILATVTRALLGAVDGRGVDRAQLLAHAGLTEREVEDPDAWVPIAKHARVGRAIMAALPGENLGLQTGTRIYGDPRGALGYVLRRSANNQQALYNFFAYQNVVNRALTVEIATSAERTSVKLRLSPELAAVCHPAEALVAAWVGISRHLTGTTWCPESVSFTHREQGDPREHEAFLGCQVRFAQAETALTIATAAGALPIAPGAHELDTVLVAARANAAELVTSEAERRALDALLAQLTGRPLDVRALAVGSEPMSNARLAFVRALLASSRSFVYEAAYLLGFLDLRQLERRFSERFGAAPRAFRAQG